MWALEAYQKGLNSTGFEKLFIYTDSQCVSGLLNRKKRLEENNFTGKNPNLPLENASLYRKFYEFHEELGFEVVKVSGHLKTGLRDTVHQIFSYVDKEARKKLRDWAGAGLPYANY